MLQMKNHPDHGGNDSAARLINEAYEILKNPEKRSEYDRSLLHNMRNATGSKHYFQLRCPHCNTINTLNLQQPEHTLISTPCTKCNGYMFDHNKEQRQFPRFSCNIRVTIESLNHNVKLSGRCKDFSRGGMMFLTSIPIKLKEKVLLTFPKHNDFQIVAEIKRVEEINSPEKAYRYKHGVLYLNAQSI